MSDHGELKRLALACGNLNWQFLTVKFTEYGIRDDHGYIAFLPVGHPAKYGACPEREAKARFLGAMTPAVVLGLLAEIERMREDACFRAVNSLRGDGKDLMAERDQLTAEVETLRKDSDRLQYLIRTSAIVCESDDLERYWLKYSDGFSQTEQFKSPAQAIDAAMGEGGQS